MGLLWFNIFTNHLNDGAECTLSKFTNDTKLGEEAEMSKVLPGGISGRLERWVDKNLIRFNKEKCRVLHLDTANSRYQEHVRGQPATQQPGRKGSGNLGGLQVEHETAMCPYH